MELRDIGEGFLRNKKEVPFYEHRRRTSSDRESGHATLSNNDDDDGDVQMDRGVLYRVGMVVG